MSALCPAKAPPITKGFAAAWVAALSPYDAQEIRDAAMNWARRKPFFPTVSDLTRGVLPGEKPRDDLAIAEKLFPQPTELRNDLALARKLLEQRKRAAGEGKASPQNQTQEGDADELPR